MTRAARPSARAIRRHVDPADNKLENVGTAYNKGKTVLGMFESWAGPDMFQRGVLDYLNAHEWGNAKAADLWSALSKASGRDLGAAMETFLDQPGLPLVTVEPLEDGRVRLAQRRFANFGARLSPQTWQIPVTLEFSDGRTTGTRTLLLDSPTQIVTLGSASPVWVLPDAGASGYYRWSVPPAMLQKLAEVAPGALTPRERIGFLRNLGALLDAGEIHGDDYLKAIGRLSTDTRPQAPSA